MNPALFLLQSIVEGSYQVMEKRNDEGIPTSLDPSEPTEGTFYLITLLPCFNNSWRIQRNFRKEMASSHSNPNYLENVLNNELLNIDVWSRCNKLSINVQETNYVILSSSQRKVNHSFSLSFGGQSLPQSNVTKFLGVYLDEHLT